MADIQIPTAMAAAKTITVKTGIATSLQDGQKLYQIMRPIRIIPDMRKSTKLTITELVGMTRRGKYTFEMRLAFPIKLLLDSDKALAKNCQGNRADKTSIG